MKKVIQRFLKSGWSMEEISKKMKASVSDLEKLII
jgi:ribosome-binding protein aMBF1 (putative translation factor)